MSQNFTKEEFLKLLSQDDRIGSPMDDLDRKALEGFAYLEEGETPESVLARIDDRFEDHLESITKVQNKEARIFSFQRIQRLAAVMLLLLIPAYFLFKAPSTEQLFVEHFEAPRSTYFQQTRGEANTLTDDAAFKSAFQQYEMGNYEEARSAIANLALAHPDKPDLKFYQAMATLGAGQAKKAIELFTECLEVDYQNVNNRTPWYLALSYLKNGDKAEALQWLKKSVEVDSRHEALAHTLIKDLD